MGIHTSDHSKQLSNISSVSIVKKPTLAKLLFHGRRRKGDRPPGCQLTVASVAGRAAAAALYCRDGLTLSAPFRCGAIGGGGGVAGDRCTLLPGRDRDVGFPSLIHSYDNTIGPWLVAAFCNIIQHNIQPTLSAGAR